jgi:hypothetical protein
MQPVPIVGWRAAARSRTDSACRRRFVARGDTVPAADKLLAVKIVVAHLANAADEQVYYHCERLRSRRLSVQPVGHENTRRLSDQGGGISDSRTS